MQPLNENQDAIQTRKRLFKLFGGIVLSIAVILYAYWVLVASKQVSTDDAYAAANIADVSAATGGIVKAIHVVDTQKVKKGDVLVTLDDIDAMLALKKAEANAAHAEADLLRTKSNFERRQRLVTSGYLSKEEFSNASSALKEAEANNDLAKANLDQARVDLERVIVRAPVDGVIAKRDVQLGQRITAGTHLLSVIPVSNIYVNANFKEVQLRHVRVGQPVELHADIYGSKVTYYGRVAGIAGGTGASFAVIPAQNATGNWIKVVQRIPVRIELDPESLAANPLQVGLSMYVKVNTGKHLR